MVRAWLFAAMLIVGCKQKESPSPEPEPKPAVPSPSAKAGAPVTPGSLKRTPLKSSYVVAVPTGSDVAALEKLVRSKSPDVEVTRTSIADMFNEDQLALMTKRLTAADAATVKGATVSTRARRGRCYSCAAAGGR